jgi:hypothetical protein
MGLGDLIETWNGLDDVRGRNHSTSEIHGLQGEVLIILEMDLASRYLMDGTSKSGNSEMSF